MNKQYSMRRNSEFSYVYRRGKNVSNAYLVLYHVKGGGGATRVGFSVSKKLGKAVVRNRTKRLLRENFRLMTKQVKPGLYIFVARNAAAGSDYHTLGRAMRQLLAREALLLPAGESAPHEAPES